LRQVAANGIRTSTSKPITGACAKSPISRCAELPTELKARGLLDSTLVIWGGEFGRTPFNESGNGRDHNRGASPCGWQAME